MKKWLFVLALACILTGCNASSGLVEEKNATNVLAFLENKYGIETDGSVPKVILDCDMTYLGDDAMCMCILAQADEIGLIDLLGITITGGNSFVSVGTNAALCQLEQIGREDIPVYMGTDEPIGGFRNLAEQEWIVGRIDAWGAMNNLEDYVAPYDYHNLGNYYERKWGYSQTEPQNQNSVDFMIEQVGLQEGEVTILSCGAPVNIALACEKDTAFASKTAGIIYMGGILEGTGSYTPYADFNCFYDAAAFDICFKSEFPFQKMIPHDVVNQVMLNKAVFDLLDAKEDTLISKLWLDNQYGLYRRTTTREDNCADAIAAVILLLPDVVQETREFSVEINTDIANPEYGAITAREAVREADGSCRVTFITRLDTEKYWDFVTDLLCRVDKESAYTYSYFVEANHE